MPGIISPMKQTVLTIMVAGTLFVFSDPASAENGRYTMTPTKDGILKLDTRTGAVSLCSRSPKGWSCNSVDSNDRNSRSRIRELEEENAQLRAQLKEAQRGAMPGEGGKIDIPSEEDVDKAMDFMERLLHRFKGMVEDLKKEKKQDEEVPL